MGPTQYFCYHPGENEGKHSTWWTVSQIMWSDYDSLLSASQQDLAMETRGQGYSNVNQNRILKYSYFMKGGKQNILL